MTRIAVLGDVMLDVTLEAPEVRPSFEHESAFVVRGTGWQYNLGGAGCVAEVLGTFEWPQEVKPVLCGVVGFDGHGKAALELVERLSRPIPHGVTVAHNRVTTAKVRAGVAGLPRVLPRLDVEDEYPDYVDWHFVKIVTQDCDAVILADYRKGFFATWPENWREWLPPGVPVIVDAKPADIWKYAGATVWCPSGRELAGLDEAYANSWSDLAEVACADHGLDFTCVTLGEAGCYVCAGDEATFMPASARRAFVSAIGAGDAFCAGMAVSLALHKGEAPQFHARFAQETAEKYVTQERYRHAPTSG